MDDKMKHWNNLCETDPKYTKTFKCSGGFTGTAQNPTYAIRKMTEHFGAVGDGWGMEKPEYEYINAQEGQVLIYCTACIWWKNQNGEKCYSYGEGGDFAVGSNKYGLFADDEGRKKAYTDALGNALKFLGVGADLYLGMYDDSKYVNSLREKHKNDKPASIHVELGADDIDHEIWMQSQKDILSEHLYKPKTTPESLEEKYQKATNDKIYNNLNDGQKKEFREHYDELAIKFYDVWLDKSAAYIEKYAKGEVKDKNPTEEEFGKFCADIEGNAYYQKASQSSKKVYNTVKETWSEKLKERLNG